MNWNRFWKSRLGRRLVAVRQPRRRASLSLEQLESRLNLSAVLLVETADSYWMIEEPNFGMPSASTADATKGGSTTDSTGTDATAYNVDSASAWDNGSTTSDNSTDDNFASLLPTVATDTVLSQSETNQMSDMLAELMADAELTEADVWSIQLVSNTTIDQLVNSNFFDDGSGDRSVPVDTPTENVVSNSPPPKSNGNSLNNLANNVSTNFSASSSSNNSSAAARSGNAVPADVLRGSAGTDVISEDHANSDRSDTNPASAKTIVVSVASTGSLELQNVSLLAAQSGDVLVKDSRAKSESGQSTFVDASDETIASKVSAHSGQKAIEESTSASMIDRVFARFQSDALEVGSVSGVIRYLKSATGFASSNDASGDGIDEPTAGLSYAQIASLVGVIGLGLGSIARKSDDDRRDVSALERNRRPKRTPVIC